MRSGPPKIPLANFETDLSTSTFIPFPNLKILARFCQTYSFIADNRDIMATIVYALLIDPHFERYPKEVV